MWDEHHCDKLCTRKAHVMLWRQISLMESHRLLCLATEMDDVFVQFFPIHVRCLQTLLRPLHRSVFQTAQIYHFIYSSVTQFDLPWRIGFRNPWLWWAPWRTFGRRHLRCCARGQWRWWAHSREQRRAGQPDCSCAREGQISGLEALCVIAKLLIFLQWSFKQEHVLYLTSKRMTIHLYL